MVTSVVGSDVRTTSMSGVPVVWREGVGGGLGAEGCVLGSCDREGDVGAGFAFEDDVVCFEAAFCDGD